MCAAFNHAGHDYKPAAEVSGEHRDAIGAQVAVTVVSRDEVFATKTGWEGACVQLRRNGEAAIEKLNLEFRRMAQQGTKRRDVLIAQVKAVVLFKLGLLEAQVKGGDASDDHSTEGIKLVEATMEIATPAQVLQYKTLLMDGLRQLQNHELVLKQCCGPSVDVTLGDAFEQFLAQIGTLGAVLAGDTDAAASTATGDGLAAAKVVAAFLSLSIHHSYLNHKVYCYPHC
jgi:hypothetical protein